MWLSSDFPLASAQSPACPSTKTGLEADADSRKVCEEPFGFALAFNCCRSHMQSPEEL